MTANPLPADLLHGMAAIASHLGMRERQARYLATIGEIPTFKLRRSVCALRSKLDDYLAAKARQQGEAGR